VVTAVTVPWLQQQLLQAMALDLLAAVEAAACVQQLEAAAEAGDDDDDWEEAEEAGPWSMLQRC
jgi:hypothetical protein